MILSSSKWTSLWSPFSSLCCREGGKGRGLTCAVPSSWRRLWTRTLPHALHTRSQPHPAEVDREALNTLCFAQSWVWSPSFSPPVISSGLIAPWDSRPGHQASHHCPPWPALMWRPLPSAGVNSNQVLFISMGTVLNSQQMFIFAVVCLIAKHQFLLFYCLDLCTKKPLQKLQWVVVSGAQVGFVSHDIRMVSPLWNMCFFELKYNCQTCCSSRFCSSFECF